ncbi:MAG: hypothetical protein UW60_C0044G0003 [Candidatus Woesebacteria bacterium GW2011_GWA2_44_33]|uniref:Uncharacterized protein n=1 Tax=Candidatus Woesebacteria bacterium GW2011_GWA2_44_33 TaxID=1618564 RepID=A0A0G1M0G6_9BACT|nr:MAG: hypothetical protein UW60_C0044G0003 [Candidatus Woesebacteria bacterium GW2011_GWA2_44_33]
MKIKKYLKVWFQLAHISFAEQLATRFSSILFLIGKIARFSLFLVFLISLTGRSGGLAGYTADQLIVFFLVFNLADILTQLFFRGVYFFHQKVVSGEFDFYLVKPMNPLFRIMAGYTDFLDLITLFALGIYAFAFFKSSSLIITPQNAILFIVMLILSFLIALTIHIIVVSIGIITTEVDHTIMIYRDLTQMGRIPVDVYAKPVRLALTYIVPIAVMITVPAQALLGLLSPLSIFISLFLASCFLFLSLRFFRHALSQYSSASS